MKYAVIGHGKTGSKVAEILQEQKIEFEIFNSKKPITCKSLKDFELAIVFIPGEIFEKMIPELLAANIPIVCGATGHSWPQDLDQKLKEKKLSWCYSSNFAPGMSFIYKLLADFNKVKQIAESPSLSIREVHHTKKLDAPSGTALTWSEKLNKNHVEIDCERVGDEIGFHELKLELPFETITLSHKSLDRKVFANGAVELAKKISSLDSGLINYENYLQEKLKNEEL